MMNSSIHKRTRHEHNRLAKTEANKIKSERTSRTALVLGGGAPNMPLMAGALAAFEDEGIYFDVVSTSGAGGLAGLLWLAPKAAPPREALAAVTQMCIPDLIYSFFPVNYKVFLKPGMMAGWTREMMAANPLAAWHQQACQQWPAYSFWADIMSFWNVAWTPSDLTWLSSGLCAPVPFIEQIIDFSKIKSIPPYFYLNAYNATQEQTDNFSKDVLTPEHFRAALAFPFIYGPYRLNNDMYYEGAVIDCLNLKDLVELHPGLETIVVLDVLGTNSLIRAPRNLYDSWVLSMIIPLVKVAEDNLELFIHKHKSGETEDRKAKEVLKVVFNVPDEHLNEVLDWTVSNAERLFGIGYAAGKQFVNEHDSKLKRAGR